MCPVFSSLGVGFGCFWSLGGVRNARRRVVVWSLWSLVGALGATLWVVSDPRGRVMNAGDRRQEQISRREGNGVPAQSRSWPPLAKEAAVVTLQRMVEGTVSPDDGSKIIAAAERTLRMLEGGVVGRGPGRPAKSADGRRANDPLLEAQLAELAEVIGERDAGSVEA